MNKYYCQISAMTGSQGKDYFSVGKDNFYTLVMKNSDKNKNIRRSDVRIDGLLVWEFTSDVERDNFISFCKTYFCRFCLSLLKSSLNNSYGNMSLIPQLDFTQEWTDEKLFEYFDIDQKTQEYIYKFLPDYYGLLED